MNAPRDLSFYSQPSLRDGKQAFALTESLTPARPRPQPLSPRSAHVSPGARDQRNNNDGPLTAPSRSLEFYNTFGAFLCCLLLFLIGGWATLASISGAVIAQARVVVDGGTQSIQHLEGGLVRQIKVRDGQFVEKGAILIELETNKALTQTKFLDAQAKSLRSQLTLIDEQLTGLAELFEKGLSRKSELLVTRRRRVELQGKLDENRARLNAVRDEVNRASIRAPLSGYVHELQAHTVGGVVQAGETMLQIIAAGSRLRIRAKIDPKNIDQVKVGQPVTVRFTSFDQRTTPELAATVDLVAADLSRDREDLPPYFTVRIGLDAEQLKRLGTKRLRPGMPAEVFIQTGMRSVLSYFVRPLTDHFERALRE